MAHIWDDELGIRKWTGESSNRSRTNSLEQVRLWGDEVDKEKEASGGYGTLVNLGAPIVA